MAVSFQQPVSRALVKATKACGLKVDSRQPFELLFSRIVWRGEHLSIYLHTEPRTAGHLVIRVKNAVKHLHELPEHTYLEVMKVMRMVQAIKPEWDFATCWRNYYNELIFEILPGRPTEKGNINQLDLFSLNQQVYCPTSALPKIPYSWKKHEYTLDMVFWLAKLREPPALPPEENTTAAWDLVISHKMETVQQARWNLKALLEAKGGKVEGEFKKPNNIAVDQNGFKFVQDNPTCILCEEHDFTERIITIQDGVTLLYKSEGWFELITKEHRSKLVYATEAEHGDMFQLQRLLEKAILAKYPNWQIVTCERSAPSVGQTVRHAHLEIRVFDPEMTEIQTLQDVLNPKATDSSNCAIKAAAWYHRMQCVLDAEPLVETQL